MIKKLAEILSQTFAATGATEGTEEDREGAIRMATAVLMTEIARADHEYDGTEFDLLLQLVTRHFHMSPEDAVVLANEARDS